MYLIPFQGIEFANSRSALFRTGMLQFADNERAEIFDALGVDDWKETLWTEDDIKDTLLHPTFDKLQRLLRIRDYQTIERVRGHVVHMRNLGTYPVTPQVTYVVNERSRELMRGIVNTRINLTPASAGISSEAEENDKLRKRAASLERQLEELRGKLEVIESNRESAETGTQQPTTRKARKK